MKKPFPKTHILITSLLFVAIVLAIGPQSHSAHAQEPAGAPIPAAELCLNDDSNTHGSVSGTVRSSATGDPIAGVIVRMVDLYGRTLLNDTTSITGTWSIDSAWPVSYYVRFLTNSNLIAQPYISEVYSNQSDISNPNIVKVEPGQVITGFDASLEIGAVVEGKVTSTAGGAGISGVSVQIYAAGSEEQLDTVVTNGTGEYRSKAGFAPGDYVLRFVNFDYESEYFENAEDFESATPITVIGTQTKVVNAALTPRVASATGVIKGRVTMADTGNPLPTAQIAPRSAGNDGAFASTVSADAQGFYTATVPVGSWRMLVYQPLSASPYAPRYLGGDGSQANAEVVNVTANAVVANKNIALAKGWYIEGTISGPGNVPLDLVYVSAFDGDNSFESGFNDGDQSLPDGSYKLGPLPPFAMTVDFLPSSFDCTLIDTRQVVLPPAIPTDTVTISPALIEGALITGRVTSGAPSGGERTVQARFFTGSETYFAISSETGYYLSPALPAATYKVGFFKDGFADLFYNNKPDQTSATSVSTVAGQATTGIDAFLSAGGGNDDVFAPLILK